jgi:hypothetical protein
MKKKTIANIGIAVTALATLVCFPVLPLLGLAVLARMSI